MWYKNIAGRFFGLVTKRACDGQTDGRTNRRTDGQNYDSQDRASIDASRGQKLYLKMKQKIYWENLYVDVRNFMAECQTCHIAKGDDPSHKTQNSLPGRPTQIFQRVHLDHLKISVKGATHPYTHALVIIDATPL